MADVYVARHGGAAGFDKIVAIKLLREQDDCAGFRDMFLEEVRTAALLNHPCIVQTFDAGELGERLYMTMEFVNGETLGRFARAVIGTAGRFPCELALAIVRDLANALEYAHTLTNLDGVPLQLVHRDVSPSNVLVSFDGMVKLLDFGIAKVATQVQMTGAGIIKGKFSYMSPEQARGGPIDQRADIYSLGVVLWQLLTGRAAFHADSDAELLRLVMAPRLVPPSQAGAACSEEVDEIAMAALAPTPDDRYQTAGEFANALARYMTRRAAGFDATKVIRGLMAAHFRERRERLAQLVRASDREMPAEDIEHLAQPPSIRPPAPHADARTSATANTLDTTGIPATVAPTTARAPAPRGRWQGVALLATIVAGAGYLTLRETTSPVEQALAPPRPAATSPAVVTAAPPTVVTAATTTEAPVELVAPTPLHRAPDAPSAATRPVTATRPGARVQPSRTPVTRVPGRADADTRSMTVSPSALAPAGEEPVAGTDAEPRDAGPARSGSVVDAGSTPATSERRARLVETVGTLDAVPRLTRVSVDGSLPTSELRSAIERVQSTLRGCYRGAARRAARTPALTIKVWFEIDEGRSARRVRISGDTLGLAGCVEDALASIRTRVAPDVGTVAVTALIEFDPVD